MKICSTSIHKRNRGQNHSKMFHAHEIGGSPRNGVIFCYREASGRAPPCGWGGYMANLKESQKQTWKVHSKQKRPNTDMVAYYISAKQRTLPRLWDLRKNSRNKPGHLHTVVYFPAVRQRGSPLWASMKCGPWATSEWMNLRKVNKMCYLLCKKGGKPGKEIQGKLGMYGWMNYRSEFLPADCSFILTEWEMGGSKSWETENWMRARLGIKINLSKEEGSWVCLDVIFQG